MHNWIPNTAFNRHIFSGWCIPYANIRWSTPDGGHTSKRIASVWPIHHSRNKPSWMYVWAKFNNAIQSSPSRIKYIFTWTLPCPYRRFKTANNGQSTECYTYILHTCTTCIHHTYTHIQPTQPHKQRDSIYIIQLLSENCWTPPHNMMCSVPLSMSHFTELVAPPPSSPIFMMVDQTPLPLSLLQNFIGVCVRVECVCSVRYGLGFWIEVLNPSCSIVGMIKRLITLAFV